MAKCLHCMEREANSGLYCSFCLYLKPDLAAMDPTSTSPARAVPAAPASEESQPDQMQRFYAQQAPRPRDPRAPRERPRVPAWLGAGLALSLLANGALAGFLFDTRRDFAAAEDLFDAKVRAAEEELAAVTAAAIAQVPDVDTIKRDLDDLESKLFGISGGGFRRDIIGSLEADMASAKRSVTSLSFDLSSFKSCMNRALSNAIDSYDRAVSSYFGSSYFVPKCY